MEKYASIKNVWKRDPDNKYKTLIDGAWSTEAIDLLAETPWSWQEKVDGMNIRIIVRDGSYEIAGRTDKAELRMDLVERLTEYGEQIVAAGITWVTFYGEGYGAGIQKGGGNYSAKKDFSLFDIKRGNIWLPRVEVRDLANQCGLLMAPTMGTGDLHQAIHYARYGFNSSWGDFPAEGIICRPATELWDCWHERVICKIKTKDFVS